MRVRVRLVADRRLRSRTHVNQAFSYEFYASDGQKLGGGFGTAINISNEGMMFETSVVLESQMTVLVELIGPLHTLMATGTVAHVRQASEAACQVGVRFHQLIQGGWDIVVEPLRRMSED